MNTRALINGEPGDRVSIYDRGFQFGDGVFETVAVLRGQPVLWQAHLDRLTIGAQRLGIEAPAPAMLHAEALRLGRDVASGVLKIVLTRGVSGRGYGFDPGLTPNRVLSLSSWPIYPPDYARAGVVVRVCRTPLAHNPSLAGIKHLNRLEQVLARAECGETYAEGIMRNEAGTVIEGTMSNLFLIREGELCTPDLSECGVAGIMRGCVLALAQRLALPYRVAPLAWQDLRRADEVFLTNSLIGLWPVRRIDGLPSTRRGKEYTIGETTRRIQQALHARCFSEEVP